MSEVTELLEKAANVIAERGHCKGELENSLGEVCAMGALNVAAHGLANPVLTVSRPAYMPALESLMTATNVYNVPEWNDRDETSAEDVILAFKTAAKNASES